LVFQDEKLLQGIESLVSSADWKSRSIVTVGKIAHQQLQPWYSSADFIISGSHYEGSGVAVAEAMSCGCIPIVTDIPSFRAMTGRGKCGFLYKPGDQGQLLELLIAAKGMDLEAERTKVLAQFKNELSFAAIAEKINHIIKLQTPA
jgi:glycosyltransferase involved in cell wall biosynthesis